MSRQFSAESVSCSNLRDKIYGEVLNETFNQTFPEANKFPRPSAADLQNSVNVKKAIQEVVTALQIVHSSHPQAFDYKSAHWRSDHNEQFDAVIKSFQPLDLQEFAEWGVFEQFWAALPHQNLLQFLNFPLGLEIENSGYNLSLTILSKVLTIFEKIYFRSVIALKPRIQTKSLSNTDPLFRQCIRERNLNDSQLSYVFFRKDFNVKMFALKALDKVFPYVQSQLNWEQIDVQAKVLRVILKLLQLGLWSIEEADDLMSRVYHAATRLFNIERFYGSNEKKSEQSPEENDNPEQKDVKKEMNGEETAKWLVIMSSEQRRKLIATNILLCRVLVGKILLQVVTMHLDFELIGTFPMTVLGGKLIKQLCEAGRTAPTSKAFCFERMRKKRLYTYYAYTLVNYLLCGLNKEIPELHPDLALRLRKVNMSLMAFMSNIKADFFFNSLLSLNSQNLPFYTQSIEAYPFDESTNIYLVLKTFCKSEIAILNPNKKGPPSEESMSKLKGIMDSIRKVFRTSESFDRVKSCQMAFILTKVDRVLVSIVSDWLKSAQAANAVNQKLTSLISELFELLVIMCMENLQCVSQLFNKHTINQIVQLYECNQLHGAFFFMQSLRNRPCTRLLLTNEKLRVILNDKFNAAVKKLLEEMANAKSNPNALSFETVGTAFFLAKVLKSAVKSNDALHLRISTLTATTLSQHLLPILMQILNSQSDMQFKDLDVIKMTHPKSFVQLRNRLSQQHWNPNNYLGLLTFECIIGLFATSTRQFFTPEVHAIVSGIFARAELKLSNFFPLMTSQLGIRICRKITKVYSNFNVFAENCFLHNAFEKNLFDFYFTQNTHSADLISTELTTFANQLCTSFEQPGEVPEHLVKLLYKGCLSITFKFVSGFLAAYSDERFKKAPQEVRVTLHQMIDKILEAVQKLALQVTKLKAIHFGDDENWKQVQKFISDIDNSDLRVIPHSMMDDNIDSLRSVIYQTLRIIASMFRLRPKYLNKIAQYYTFSKEGHRDRLRDNMATVLSSHIKFRIDYGLKDSDFSTDFHECAKRGNEWNVECPRVLFSGSSCPPYTFSLLSELRSEAKSEDLIARLFQLPQLSNPTVEAIIPFYRQRYWHVKGEMIDNNDKNQLFRILKYPDPIYKSTQVVVNYLVREWEAIPLTLGENSSSFFSLNEHFQTLFILADNLLRMTPAYRSYLYKVIMRNPEVFEKLWNLKQMLFDLVAYRTFWNDSWNTLFSSFYLVSCFFQNLCENNFVPFKNYIVKIPIQEAQFVKEDEQNEAQSPTQKLSQVSGPMSKLALYNRSILKVILESEVHHREKIDIDARDRDEYDIFYCRAIEEVNEYITGGDIHPEPVHRTRIDVWCGILFRRDPDFNSTFYKVKLNVALYINSLIESNNKHVIDYLSNKIFVQDLIDECVFMMSLLYLKTQKADHSLMFNALRQMSQFNETSGNQGPGLDLNGYVTLDPASLIHYYKKGKEHFAEHTIIDIVVALYRFMKKLKDYDLRYSFVIQELDKLTAQKDENDGLESDSPVTNPTSNDPQMFTQNQIACWWFMKQIVSEIELVVEVSNEKQEIVSQVINYQFKKLPVCFFDSKEIRDHFVEDVPVDSVDAKREAFINKVGMCIEQLKSQQVLYRCLGKMMPAVSEFAMILVLCLMYWLVVVINVLSIIFYNRETENFDSPRYGDAGIAVTTLTIIDAFVALVSLVVWFVFHYPTERKLQAIAFKEINGSKSKMRPWHRFYYYYINAMFRNEYFGCFALHLILSLLGFFSPFFYTLMLFLVIQFSAVLRGVCMAILSNLKRLFWTLVIIVIVLNFFALIVTEWMNGNLNEGNSGGCSSYLGCFFNTINVGIVQDGSIRSYLTDLTDIRVSGYTGIFFVKLFSFLLVTLFLLGMFFGIIVDAFSEYVSGLGKREEDLKNVCFSCGLTRQVLERHGVVFQKHIATHWVFKYLYYIIYLQETDTNSYSGVDYQVAEILKGRNRTAFIPKMLSKELIDMGVKLRKQEDDDEDKTEG